MKALFLIMGSTLVSEDAALAAAAALWASGHLGFETTFWGSFFGIGLGDLGLYGLGRCFGPWVLGWLSAVKLEQSKKFLGKNGMSVVLFSRFIPGARLTGYTAAGMLNFPSLSFALAVWVSTAIWVSFWFSVLGPFHGLANWPGLLAFLLFAMLFFHWLAKGFQKYEWRLRLADIRRLRWPEFWPSWLFYLPVTLSYIWLSFKHRGVLIPSLSNPGIDNGGLINESKNKIFGIIGEIPERLEFQVWEPGAQPILSEWPLIAKPDAGQRGSGVRLLFDQEALNEYAKNAGFRFITQRYCPLPLEAGVFYVRRPDEAEGQIFSVTRKIFPWVKGDGNSTLADLILKDPRHRHMARIFFKRHAGRLQEILALGEVLRLVESGNHSQGAIFLNGRELAGEGLRRRLDTIAHSMPGFCVGRFDLRYGNDEELAQGLNFKIIEVNGASSEATHIYDPSVPLWEVYSTLFAQWSMIFEIGSMNRSRGLKPTTAREFLHCLRDYRRSSRSHPIAS